MSPLAPPQHRPAGWKPPSRHGSADPFYQSPEWGKFRLTILERDGYRCTWVENGSRCIERAVVVDHPTPRSEGGADFDPACRSLCRTHDNQRHREKGSRHD